MIKNKKGLIDIGFYIILILIILNIIVFFKSPIDTSILILFGIISIFLILLFWTIGGMLFGIVGMEIGMIIGLLFSLWLIQTHGVIIPFLT